MPKQKVQGQHRPGGTQKENTWKRERRTHESDGCSMPLMQKKLWEQVAASRAFEERASWMQACFL
eukprot:12906595-Prorocentrum_lima.AAC.1